jgi:hypothetical protein
MTTAGALTWEFSGKFDQRAADYLADRYERQGYKATADAVRLGMPSDHEDHVVLVAITEFLSALPEAPAAGVKAHLLSRLTYPVDRSINSRGWEVREPHMIEEAVRFIQEDLDSLLSSPPVQTAAVDGEIAETVINWMVKYDLLDAGNEYHASDVLAVLNDLAPTELDQDARLAATMRGWLETAIEYGANGSRTYHALKALDLTEVAAALASQVEGDDWVLVPRKLTLDMEKAFWAERAKANETFPDVPRLWRSILAAVPVPDELDKELREALNGIAAEDAAWRGDYGNTLNKDD